MCDGNCPLCLLPYKEECIAEMSTLVVDPFPVDRIVVKRWYAVPGKWMTEDEFEAWCDEVEESHMRFLGI